ncbi:MAG: hypothetical protein HZC43_12460 [Nitrosomonadales bacterium]|nr:hypothetical protein [Nitrosomonadales bacterium]
MRSYKFNKFIKQIFEALRFFQPKSKDTGFSVFMSGIPQTRKQRLIEECKRQEVSIYIDDPTEQSAGIYAELRGVGSEAELERRLNTKKTIALSKCTSIIAFSAFIVSTIALIKSFL